MHPAWKSTKNGTVWEAKFEGNKPTLLNGAKLNMQIISTDFRNPRELSLRRKAAEDGTMERSCYPRPLRGYSMEIR